MKYTCLKYFLLLGGILFFISCNSHKNDTSTRNTDTDPVFSENPHVKNITEQINKSPKDAALYFERGGMLHKLKLDTLALKDYKKAASLDTNQGQYYSAVGDMLFENKDINGSI